MGWDDHRIGPTKAQETFSICHRKRFVGTLTFAFDGMESSLWVLNHFGHATEFNNYYPAMTKTREIMELVCQAINETCGDTQTNTHTRRRMSTLNYSTDEEGYN